MRREGCLFGADRGLFDAIADEARLAVDALENAVARRANPAGCIVHSDRGSQFRARKFMHALNRHGLVGSMGRVGTAGDNAAMESFSRSCKRTFWTGGGGLPGRHYA